MKVSKHIGVRPKTSFMIEFIANYKDIKKGTQSEVYIDPAPDRCFMVYKKSNTGSQFLINGSEDKILNTIKFLTN